MRVISPASEREILSFFRSAAQTIHAIVLRGDPKRPFTVYRREQLGAIAKVIAQLDADSKGWVEENIPTVMEKASEDTLLKIDDQGENDFSFAFSGVPSEAVKVLTEKAYLDFGHTVQGLKINGDRAAINKRAIQREIIQGTIQGRSIGGTQKEIMQALNADGLNRIVYRNNAKVPVEAYVNMLVRTQTMTAYNTAASQQMLAAGRMFAIFPTIPPGKREPDDPCWAWEKKKYVNLLTDPLPPASTHCNCRHTLQPVSMQQLQAERPDLYEEALKYFQKAANG